MEHSNVGAAVHFLVDVEALSVPFLIVMAVLFIGGTVLCGLWLVILRRSLSTSEADYTAKDSPHQIHDPKEFLHLSTRDESLMGMLDLVPQALVSVGILGTFIGLGVAIGAAADTMSEPGAAIQGLQELLAAVSFKFQTSAWGILLSVAFMLGPRSLAGMLLENWFERAALRMAAARGRESDVVVDALEDMRRELESVIEVVRALAESNKEIAPAVVQLGTAVDRLDSTSSNFSSGVGQSVERLAGLQAGIQESLDGIGPRVAKELQGGLDKFDASVERSMKTLTGSVSTIPTEIAKVEPALKGLETSIPKALDRSLGKMEKQLAGSMGDLRTAVESVPKEMSKVEPALRSLETGVPKALKHSMADMQKQVIDQQKKSAQELQKALDRPLNLVAGASTKLSDELMPMTNRLTAQLEAAIRKYEVRLEDLNRQLGRLVEREASADLDALVDNDLD